MAADITPEMARAELARRRQAAGSGAAPGPALGSAPGSASGGITPEMARAELERRRASQGAAPSGPFPAGDPRNAFLAEARERVAAGERAPDTAGRHRGMADGEAPQGMSFRQAQEWAARRNRGTLADAGVGANQGFSLGFGDEVTAAAFSPLEMILGAISGEDDGRGILERVSAAYDRGLALQRGQMTAARERSPAAYTAGQVAVSLVVPAKTTTTVRGGAAQGAALGGVTGFGSGEGGFGNRLESAASGAVLGGAIGGGVQKVANVLSRSAARASIPSTDELRAAGTAAYQAADDLGVVIRPDSAARLAQTIKDDLADFGYDTALHPGIGAALARLDDMAAQPTTLKGMEIVRRVARNAGRDIANPSQAEAARIVVDRLDDFLGRLQPGDVLAGNADAAGAAMTNARDLWGRMRKSEMVEDAAERAGHRASSTGTGGNVDNALRQGVRAIIDNPRLSRGLTPAERAAAKRVVRGTPVQNIARLAGRLSMRGNGPRGYLGLGALYANPTTAIPTLLAAEVAKRYADRATPRNVQALLETIRSGGKTATEIALEAARGRGDAKTVAMIERYMSRARGARSALAPSAAAQIAEARAYLEDGKRRR